MTRLVKWLRLLGFARGALSRRSDRAQRAVFVAAAAAALLAIPVAADVAGGVRSDPVDAMRQTTAVLTEDTHLPVSSSEYGPVDGVRVKATWRTPGGVIKSGDVKVTADLKAGARVPIWTDNVGNVLDGPETSGEYLLKVFLAIVLAVLGWLAGVLVCYVLLAWLLFHRRVASWDDAWERADRDWRRAA